MNTMFYVLCIVAIAIGADVYKKYLKMKERKKENDPDLEESIAKIETLEERIRVLERIVTEHKYDLRKEIDNLK